VNEVRARKSTLVAVPLALGLILVAAALVSIPASVEQNETQTVRTLFYDGTESPSTLEPSQGNLPLSFHGAPNSTLFQIEIDCDAPYSCSSST
jgi:ABC-type transport system substrate-binding protein